MAKVFKLLAVFLFLMHCGAFAASQDTGIAISSAAGGKKANLQLHLQLNWPQVQNESNNYESEIKSFLAASYHNNWYDFSNALRQLAEQLTNATHINWVYEVLWQQFQLDKMHYNAYHIRNFYAEITLGEHKLTLRNWTAEAALSTEVRTALVTRCAEILEGSFYYNGNGTTESNVLKVIYSVKDDVLEDELIQQLLDRRLAVASSSYALAYELRTLVNETNEFYVKINLALWQRLGGPSSSNGLDAQAAIADNLSVGEAFAKLSPAWQDSVRSLISKSRFVLRNAERVCFRNLSAPSNATAMYECPRSYSVCSRELDVKMATFQINRQDQWSNRLSFYSPYWGRYLVTSAMSNVNGINVAKTVASSQLAYFWQVNYYGDKVVLMDTTGGYYLCASNPAYWTSEPNVYMGNVNYYLSGKRDECEWTAEAC